MNKNKHVIKLLTFFMSMLPPPFSAQDYIHPITFPQQLLQRTSKLVHIHYLHNHQLDTPYFFVPPMARVYTLAPPQSRHQKN